jgi:hypothetical protein
MWRGRCMAHSISAGSTPNRPVPKSHAASASSFKVAIGWGHPARNLEVLADNVRQGVYDSRRAPG